MEPFILTFDNQMNGYHHGQKDFTLVALANGIEVGYINYSEYTGEPSIQYIDVATDFTRRGIGTALVKKLQMLYPDREIDWGSMTDDGSALKASLPTKVVYNPVYQTYLDRLEKLKVLEDKYTAIIEHKDTSQEKKIEIGNKWNQLNDLEYTLREKLRHLSVSKTLIVT